jgi:hypothetical protein
MQQEGFELPEDGVFQITLQKAVGKPRKIEYIGVFEQQRGAARASRWNLTIAVGSAAKSFGRNFNATRRPSLYRAPGKRRPCLLRLTAR